MKDLYEWLLHNQINVANYLGGTDPQIGIRIARVIVVHVDAILVEIAHIHPVVIRRAGYVRLV